MTGETHENRTIFRITGADRVKFLDNLVTNNVKPGGIAYAALQTPQGKYIADFFMVDVGDALLIDVDSDLAQTLGQRLTMYKLRADVQIKPTELFALRGRKDMPEGAFPDPRHAALGWRLYSDMPGDAPAKLGPDVLRIVGLERRRRESLIRPRAHFVPELVHSIEGF